MVARRFDTNPLDTRPPDGFVGRLFETWRLALTRVRDALADALVDLPRRLAPAEKPAARPVHWLLRPRIVWLGDTALVAGAALGVALSEPGLARTLALWAGAQSVLWALVRWLLMAYASRGTARSGAALLGASSLGLIAYAVAATPELAAVAWVASAALTWRALVILGDSRRDAGRVVALAWGAQALVVVASWIARGAILAYLISRG